MTKVFLSPLVSALLASAVVLTTGSLLLSWNQANREIIKITPALSSLEVKGSEATSANAGLLNERVTNHEERNDQVVGVAAPSLISAETVGGNAQPITSLGANSGTQAYGSTTKRASATKPSSTLLAGFTTAPSSAINSMPTQNMVGVPQATFPSIPPQIGSMEAPNPSIPVAFADTSKVGTLTDGEKTAINQSQDLFIKAVQSSGNAPNTAEYRQAWDTAAYQVDEYLRGQVGVVRFNALQMARPYHP
jgi:hypothetical protein